MVCHNSQLRHRCQVGLLCRYISGSWVLELYSLIPKYHVALLYGPIHVKLDAMTLIISAGTTCDLTTVVSTTVGPTVCQTLTYGGNSFGAACVFPFTYEGVTYTTCITLNNDQPWCATTNNYPVDKKWGNCYGKVSVINPVVL